MTIVYEARANLKCTEHETKDAAQKIVEAHGVGSVVTWAVHANLPGLKPDRVYKSCALDVFEDGVWRGVYIH